ncbi:MAG: histidine kinase [Solirubrobacterales bacterium]|nr:histidine kinase [Solirubrobacterales bacterium]
MSRLPIRLRLTLTYVALLTVLLAAVLGLSWILLQRHLARTVPAPYADTVQATLAQSYVLATIGASLLALGIGWVATGTVLAPLRRIAGIARRIDDDRLHERVRMDDGPDDELRDLATAFDAMLDRVQASVAAQQRFVANASHELRTPLTVIRTAAEVALDDPDCSVEELRAVAREAVATTERTEVLLEGLLLLAALGDQAALIPGQALDLAEVGRQALRSTQPEASAAGVVLQADLRSTTAHGDAALLERLVGNLVENAIRHGDAGLVTVHAGPTADGGSRLRVSNGGAVLEAALLPRLTQPFERVHRRHDGGTGLGLSIVRAVAEAHGGRLELSAPAVGGLWADVVLPPIAAVTGT